MTGMALIYESMTVSLQEMGADDGPDGIRTQIEHLLGDVNAKDRPFWWKGWNEDGLRVVCSFPAS